MKKIYALLAASLVASSAMAATPQVAKSAFEGKGFKVEQLKPGIESIVEKAHADNLAGINTETYTLKKKVAADADYTVKVSKNATLGIDLITADYTFEEWPLYWYTVSFTDDYAGNEAVFDIMIPCIAFLKADSTDDDNYYTSDWDYNWDYADAAYGSHEAAAASATWSEICYYMNGFYIGEIPYGYIGSYKAWSYNYSTYNGTAGYYLRPATTSGTSYDYSEAAKLYLYSYDEDAEEFEGAFYAPVGIKSSNTYTSQVGIINSSTGDVVATPLVVGWDPLDMEIGEVHVFNCGPAQDYKFTYSSTVWSLVGSDGNSCYEEYEPAQLYYLAWCSPQLSWNSKIEETSLPKVPAIVDASYTVDQVNWYRAFITLDANDDPENTLPVGEGVLNIADYRGDSYGYLSEKVRPGMVFGAYYLSATSTYSIPLAGGLGAIGQYFGYQSIPYSSIDYTTYEANYTSTFGIGDSERGFYGNVVCADGMELDYSYTGDVTYHWNVDDYTVSKTITTGVETIVSDAATVAKEYFNLQGVRMNGAPENGLYIIRETKADGTVVSKKVVK